MQQQGSDDTIPEEDGGTSSEEAENDERETREMSQSSPVPSPIPSPSIVPPSETPWREVTVSGGE